MINVPRRAGSARTIRPKILIAILILATAPGLRAQAPLPVVARVEPGQPLLVGSGVNLTVIVAAGDQRPILELPAVEGARLWKVSSSLRPISAGGIGGFQSGENAFVTRLRLVTESPGAVVVPSIIARVGDREGRSQPLRLSFENPPIAGRPPGFLGGVGDFELHAEVQPARVRVGREVEYRIRVSGPGAWGMTTRLDLARLETLPIAPRVEPLAVEVIDEPPSRSFVYRLKPSKPGEVVLPQVAIASFDPRTRRYMTRAARGVALEVVAAPVFDAGELDYQVPAASRLANGLSALGALVLAAAAIFGAVVAGRRLRSRWTRSSRAERGRAGRFAREVANRLGAQAGDESAAAVETIDALIEYARLAAGRAPGALTPDEAREAVALASGSEALGDRAARLTARCDRILFSGKGGCGGGEEASLRGDAQALFKALGRSNGWLRWGLGRGWGRRKSVAPEP